MRLYARHRALRPIVVLLSLLLCLPATALAQMKWGDVNGDGAVGAIDAQAILSGVVGLTLPTAFSLASGDANCDGSIGALDAQIVLSFVVSLDVSKFCVGATAKATLTGEIRDVVTFSPVLGASVTLMGTASDATPRVTKTDVGGQFTYYNNIADGTYKLSITAPTFQSANASSVTMTGNAPVKVLATLTPNSSPAKFAALSGRVYSSAGVPVGGATVEISGGIQTNGVFKAALTASDGTFAVSGISLNDASSIPISTFTVIVHSPAKEIGSTTVTSLTANEIRPNVDVKLAAAPTPTTYFNEGFENGFGTWVTTSGWNLRGTDPIKNTAYPTYVQLAPDDQSGGLLPLPPVGIRAAWMGSPATGNFIGTQITGDVALSGGTSVTSSSGVLTSPAFSIPAAAPHATLTFNTWFEIESVNPNADGYDIMEILVTDITTGTTTSLLRLNPFEDPAAPDRDAIPFTSGGFNRAPVWRPIYVGLDAYKGRDIKLGFCFQTVDGLYNGFRGWLIDDLRVTSDALGGLATDAFPGMTTPPRRPIGKPSRTVAAKTPDIANGTSWSCSGAVQTVSVAAVTVTPNPVSVTLGATVQLLATAKDASGNVLGGKFPTWISSNTAIATVNSTGLVTGVGGGGPVTITATIETKSGSAAVTVTSSSNTIVVNSGNNQNASAATAVTTAPSVKVTNATGSAVAGVTVMFAVASGGGSVVGASQTTNSNGIATVGSWTLGSTAGTNTLAAIAAGVNGSPITFTATATLPTVNTIAVNGGDNQSATAGAAVATAPSVKVTTPTGSPVSGLAVTFAIASGGGSITGAEQTTNGAGIATVGSWTLGGNAGSNTLRASSTGATGSPVTFTATGSSGGLNLTIDGIYLTQSTQTYLNAVPLVAGRKALARVFVKANQSNTAAPTVRVRLFQGTTLVNTYTITAPSTSVPTIVNEGELSSSWNVTIPASAMTIGLSILADVDPTGVITESSKSDNSFPLSGTTQTLDVRSVSTYKVMMIPVVQPGNVTADLTDANKSQYTDFASRVYPLTSFDVVVHAPYTYSNTLSSSYDSTWTTLLSEIYTLSEAENTGRTYFGVVHPTYSYGGTGLGYVGYPAAIGVDWTSSISGSNTTIRSMTAAHEWGHNFGRLHVDCGGPANPDLSYPYDPSTIGRFGYDAANAQLLSPNSTVDLMSYCNPRWISDYTYKAVLDFRAAHPQAGPAGAQPGLLVWGRIGQQGVVLEPAFEVYAPPSLPKRAGPYSLQATDAAGSQIFNFSFDADVIDHMPSERHFAFVVPLAVNGARPVSLRLLANGRQSVQFNRIPAAGADAAMAAITSVHLHPTTVSHSSLEWDAAAYPMALIRDPTTGQVLSFARGGRIDIAVPSRELDITFSNGVGSVRRRVSMTAK